MSPLFQSVLQGGWPFSLGWALPSGLTLLAFSYLVVPEFPDIALFQEIRQLSGPGQSLVLLLATTCVALVLSASGEDLRRVLTGVKWPKRIRARRTGVFLDRKKRLQEEVKKGQLGLEYSLAYEKLGKFPADDGEVAPTMFGNRIRALETYALDRFNLDILAFWSELRSVASQELVKELDRAAAGVDLFVALYHLSWCLALASSSLYLAFDASSAQPLWVAVVAVGLTLLWYHLGVRAVSPYFDAIQALVNTGRKPLAAALGVALPDSTNLERDMWTEINKFVFYPRADTAANFDAFREPTAKAPSQPASP